MTIVSVWVRKLSSGCEELICVSDSRLSGGARIDCVPKMIPLSRSDCAICFAGDTYYAYPLMLQLSSAIETYFPSRTRGMDIHRLKGHVLKIFNSMISSVHDYVDGMEKPDTTFIFAGYSWVMKSFEIWLIYYDKRVNRFIGSRFDRSFFGFGKIAFAGDYAFAAKKQLIQLLRERYNLDVSNSGNNGFNMEPFEVIRDILRASGNLDSVGGAPQVVKVYQHMNARPLGVFWPSKKSAQISMLGRPFLGYEKSDSWILDPDNPDKSYSVLKGDFYDDNGGI